MVYVMKVKHGDTLRRLIWENEPSGNYLSFQGLEGKIREMFQFPASAKLKVTYVDIENDEVTMQNDQDLKDACVYQKLNPLRLNVVLISPAANPTRGLGSLPSLNSAIGESLKEILKNVRPENLISLFESSEHLFRDVRHPSQLQEVMDNLSKAVASHFGSSSNNGGASTSTPATNRPETTPQDRATPAQNPVTKENERTPQAGPTNSSVHFNVGCDSCSVMPIVGIRYKSTIRDNYDLCSSCYSKVGAKAGEYEVIDRAPFRPKHCRGYRRFMWPSMGPHSGYTQRWGMRSPQDGSGGRLDARFVRDVSIFDGTELAPGTHFTKIWRVRNSGNTPWPANTQLVNVDGDILGLQPESRVPICGEGLAPGEEIELSVDCVAPTRIGRYHSTWRLAVPWGPKFGHKIWVQIKVVPLDTLNEPARVDTEEYEVQVAERGETASAVLPDFAEPRDNVEITLDGKTQLSEPVEFMKLDDTDRDNVQVAEDGNTSVTIPHEFVKSDNPDRINVQVTEDGETFFDGPFGFVKSDNIDRDIMQVDQDRDTSLAGPVEFVKSENAGGGNVPDNGDGETSLIETADNTPGDGTMAEQDTSGAQTMKNIEESFVKVDVNTIGDEPPIIQMMEMFYGSLTDEPKEVTTEVPAVKPTDAEGLLVTDEEEETTNRLLGKLQSMGFIDTVLNLELLKTNGMDLRKTVNALCSVDDWATGLADLEEMGFNDIHLNRRLMFKNQGSMKRVVKELVQLAKESSGRT